MMNLEMNKCRSLFSMLSPLPKQDKAKQLSEDSWLWLLQTGDPVFPDQSFCHRLEVQDEMAVSLHHA